MALGDKVDEVRLNVTALTARVDTNTEDVAAIYANLAAITREIAALHRAHETKIALLEREVESQKKERDERSRRAWAFGPNVVGALLSGVIAAAVAYFISRR